MTALLALLAVAGYQNRDRFGEMLGKITGGQRPSDATGVGSANAGGLGGLLGGLFGGGGAREGITEGLGELIENMKGTVKAR